MNNSSTINNFIIETNLNYYINFIIFLETYNFEILNEYHTFKSKNGDTQL